MPRTAPEAPSSIEQERSRVGVPVAESPDRTRDVPVVTANMPDGYFVAARLTDSLDELAGSYAARVPTMLAALKSLGIEPSGDPVVFAHGAWGSGGFAELAIPVKGAVKGAVKSKTLGLDGMTVVLLERGDAFSLEMEGSDLTKVVRKAEAVMRAAVEQDRSPEGGVRMYRLRAESGRQYLHLTQDLTEQEERPAQR